MPSNVSAPLVEWRGLWVGLLAIVVLAALVYSTNKMQQANWPRRQHDMLPQVRLHLLVLLRRFRHHPLTFWLKAQRTLSAQSAAFGIQLLAQGASQ